jgi:hypothetical protein
MRSTLNDLLGGLILILLEVLHEQLAQLLDLAPEVRSAIPRLGRVEQLVGDVGAGLGDGEVEDLVGFEFGVGKLAGVDGVEDGAGVFERAALS